MDADKTEQGPGSDPSLTMLLPFLVILVGCVSLFAATQALDRPAMLQSQIDRLRPTAAAEQAAVHGRDTVKLGEVRNSFSIRAIRFATR